LAKRNSAVDIAQATCAALDAVDEASRMTWLTSLSGVAVPVGSALLHFALPDLYPILDYRALASLSDRWRRTQYSIGFWLAYVARIRITPVAPARRTRAKSSSTSRGLPRCVLALPLRLRI
jgi:hypothetical protein